VQNSRALFSTATETYPRERVSTRPWRLISVTPEHIRMSGHFRCVSEADRQTEFDRVTAATTVGSELAVLLSRTS